MEEKIESFLSTKTWPSQNEYLKKYYEQVKARRGHGKAKIALARKYLKIIYNSLKNDWVFEDFNNFVLAE